MVDASRSGERSMTAVCSWCSTEIPEGATACPSCGANLVPDGDPNVPGVTAVDAASIIRSRSAPPQRGRFLAWISGESATELPSKAEQEAIAPPADDVRREMLRIALQAEVANLQAEADALRAEAVAEGRLVDAAIAPVEAEVVEGAEAAEPHEDPDVAAVPADAVPADPAAAGEQREP
jgi:hypothetical protein